MDKVTSSNMADWEALCQRCGRCCYEKIAFEGRIYYTDVPCQYLDLATRTCKVYTKRDTLRQECVRLTPEHLTKGYLPADCPYVAGIEGYQAPILPDGEVSS